MEVAISAVASELVSRFISFLMNKYHFSSHAQPQEKVVERLQHLLIRVGTIVEEADARYITNSGMWQQLKMFSEAMYRGYRVLDTLRYQAVQDTAGFDEVSINNTSRSSLYSVIPFKRSRTITEKDDKAMHLESHGALESLEIVVVNMAEFIVLLGGCERMSRRPYDVYLYTDNFMFSRHSEKQKLLSFLLQHDDPPGNRGLAVLPIIGVASTGKKTLVAHACGDERVRSRFSSILHLIGDNLLSILDHGRTMEGMILIVIEFASDVSDDDWKRFHSCVITMGKGSKVIIIGKLKRLARIGSVKPIFISLLSYEELRYLFKNLAFGSVDPAEHPRLAQIADAFAKVLHNMQGSLIATNTVADLLRKNIDVQFWRDMLDKAIRMVKSGVHPGVFVEQGDPVDMTDFALHRLGMIRSTNNVSIKKELPRVTFGEVVVNPSVRPKEDFILISWESRIPPHSSFAHFVTSRTQDTHEGTNALACRKRRGVPI